MPKKTEERLEVGNDSVGARNEDFPFPSPRKVTDPLSLPKIRWLHCAPLTLLSSFYLHVICFTLLLLSEKKILNQQRYFSTFLCVN